MKILIPGCILIAASFLPSLNEFTRFQSAAADTWRVGMALIFIGLAMEFSEQVPCKIEKLQRLAWSAVYSAILTIIGLVIHDSRALVIAFPAFAFIYFSSAQKK
jgi:hypothetical protein